MADSEQLVRINLASKEESAYLDLGFAVEPDLKNDGQTPDRTGPLPHWAFFLDSGNNFKCVVQSNDSMCVWDTFSKKKEHAFPNLGSLGGVHCFAVTSDGQVLVTGDIQNRIRSWSMVDGAELGGHQLALAVRSLVPSPSGRFVVANCFDDIALARGLRSLNQDLAYELGSRLPDDAESVLLDLQTGVTCPGFPFTVLPKEKWPNLRLAFSISSRRLSRKRRLACHFFGERRQLLGPATHFARSNALGMGCLGGDAGPFSGPVAPWAAEAQSPSARKE